MYAFADFEQFIIKFSHFMGFEQVIIRFGHVAEQKQSSLGRNRNLGIFFEATTLCHWHSTPASQTF